MKSLLDTDLYKFSMSYAYQMLYPQAEGTFEFKDRNKTVLTDEDLENIKKLFNELGSLTMPTGESKFDGTTSLEWCIKTMSYIPQFYWEWLSGFRFEPTKIYCWLDSGRHLRVSVTDYMYKVTLYEIPVLATISEYLSKKQGEPDMDGFTSRLRHKVNLSNQEGLRFSEFGTRRRYSWAIQEQVVKYLRDNARFCVGTSNVHLAWEYGYKPSGTMAHEFISFHAANFGYRMANYQMMEAWIKVFHGNLGIALTDTLTSEIFFKNFAKTHAMLFSGVRQDSGSERQFTEMAINRYNALGIDPLSKTIIFSNALDMEKFSEIARYCRGRIQCAAGIGTNLTNDMGIKAPNIVMKLAKCRMNSNQDWLDCVKISDDPGKHTGTEREIEICKNTLGIYGD